VHQVLVELPVEFIQDSSHAFIDTMRDQEVKQDLLMGSDRSLNKALKLEVVKAAVTPARLTMREVTKSPYENTAATSRVPQGWTTGMLAVYQLLSPQQRLDGDLAKSSITKTREKIVQPEEGPV
jgi:hypothetical protein